MLMDVSFGWAAERAVAFVASCCLPGLLFCYIASLSVSPLLPIENKILFDQVTDHACEGVAHFSVAARSSCGSHLMGWLDDNPKLYWW